MRILRHWKIGLGLLLVFAAGAITGGVATHQAIKRAFERSLKFENWTADAMTALQSKLKLEPDQFDRIQSIIEETGREFKTVFGKALGESGDIIVRTQRRIDEELTPAQRAIHAEMKKQFRGDLKKKLNLDLPED
jgi:hypothetical protein